LAGNYIFVIPILSLVRKYTLALVTFLFTIATVFGEDFNADSLKKVLVGNIQDTDRVNTLVHLSTCYENFNPDTSLTIGMQALALARKISWQKGMMDAWYDIGIFHDIKGKFKAALSYEDSAKEVALNNNFKVKLAMVYNVIGNILSEESDYGKSLDYYYKALAIDSNISNNMHKVADISNNIGLVYAEQGDYVKAEKFYFKALKIYDTESNKDGKAATEGNLGIIYQMQGNTEKAMKSYFNAIELDSAVKKMDAVALDYANVGNCYAILHKYAEALEYTFKGIKMTIQVGALGNLPNDIGNVGYILVDVYEYDSAREFTFKKNDKNVTIKHEALLDSAQLYFRKSAEMSENENDKLSLVYALKGLAGLYSVQKKYNQSIAAYSRALEMADSMNLLQERMEISQALAHNLMKAGHHEQATKYLDDVIALKDSLFGEEKQKQTGRLEAGFEYDKMLLEQKKENEKVQAVDAEREKRQQFVIAGITIGLLTVLAFLLLLFRRFRITNEQKKVIEEQKKEVDGAYGKLNNAHLELQEKDKDITDSIAYARKIQSAILPSEEDLKQSLGEYFVLYKPRDVVSGDFYWCYNEGNKVIFAVVDCTGHGVPGAFMSMIGNSLLNQVVIENHIDNAAEILNSVRGNLIKQLQQRGEAVSRDGMDMAVCIWDKGNNMLEYAGANNALYLVRSGINTNITGTNKLRPHGGSLLEVLPDKQPIGYQEGKMESLFTAYSIQLQKGDCIFIASDGYHDQFGGERNKKFTSRAFRDLLASLTNKSVTEQKEILNTTIEKWKRDYAQTDDICVLGVRIS